ncbi:AraC family transcriptional regulator [Microbacterium sp. YJN-G]|uniref:AraC family transcriptional regulator n=1 Tax=Microbacterium sp. YJN-G TaxID=2763257 RepID=UPI001D0C09B3|nr:AraC family transcriptional regulator [Microbacterium sp. YJN-G]
MSMMLDTRAVSPTERTDYWAAGIAEHYFPMRVESFGSATFDARLAGGAIGPLFVRSISGPPHRVARTRGMIASADPENILLYLLRRGCCIVEQDGRSCELRAGDLAVQDTSRPSSFEAPVDFDVMVVSFPRWMLGGRADAIAARAAERVHGGRDPVLRLAASLFSGAGILAEGPGLNDGDGDVVADMLLPAMLNLFRRSDDAASASDALAARMRRYALEHLRDADLGPARIAGAHHVSTRLVHKQFATAGGVSAWIRQQRLEAAAEELRSTDHPVSEVASRWGYRDPASFARAFRRAWGQSPGQVRAAG